MGRLPRGIARIAIVCLLGGLSCLASSPGRGHSAAARSAPPPLRVMTFNLRLDLASDGPNAWPHRRDWVAALIRFHGADVVGVQEALAAMLTDLEALWRGRISRMDELFAAETQQDTQHDTAPTHRTD